VTGVAAVSAAASVRCGQMCRALPAANYCTAHGTRRRQVPTDAWEMGSVADTAASLWWQVTSSTPPTYSFMLMSSYIQKIRNFRMDWF